MDFLDRFKLMITNEEFSNLSSKKVIVFGTGGVGGSVAMMLVRSGIKNLTIVDFDTIDITNVNRQIVAFSNNVGKFKVDELKTQLLLINPDAKINANKEKLSDNIENFDLKSYDYVIDCIDDLPAKKSLIKYCYQNKIRIIVSCGAGNRYKDVPNFEVGDIKKTEYDPIAKILRKFCVSEGIGKLTVAWTRQKPVKNDCKTIGSVVYYPMSMACAICSKVITDLLKN